MSGFTSDLTDQSGLTSSELNSQYRRKVAVLPNDVDEKDTHDYLAHKVTHVPLKVSCY